jgi:hypothetical protein
MFILQAESFLLFLNFVFHRLVRDFNHFKVQHNISLLKKIFFEVIYKTNPNENYIIHKILIDFLIIY